MATVLTFNTLRINVNLSTVALAAISVALSSGTPPFQATALPTLNPAVNILTGNNIAGYVDRCYAKTLSIVNGTPFTLNVATGLDPLGNTLGMVHVSAIFLVNLSTTATDDLTLGGGTHPVLGTDSYTAQANGGIVQVINPNPGYAVTGASADTITIAAAAGTVTAELMILGRSA